MPVLGLIELIFFGIFFLLMVVGTTLDRRYYNESPKWWILFGGIAAATVWFWGETDFSSIWSAVSSWSFWKPFGIYLIAGLAYSVLEFILSVRKMASLHSKNWNDFISTIHREYFFIDGDNAGAKAGASYVKKASDGKFYVGSIDLDPVEGRKHVKHEVREEVICFRDVMKRAQGPNATDEEKEAAALLVRNYSSRDEYRLSDLKKDFLQIELNPETMVVEPTVNRSRLASFIGAWTFLWPAYAVSLLLGDFLVEVFRVIGDVFSKLGGRFVRFTFADVFKV